MANFLMGIISISISAVVLSSVFIGTVKNVNQTGLCWWANGTPYECGWSSAETALYGLLGIAAIAGMLYGVLAVFGIA